LSNGAVEDEGWVPTIPQTMTRTSWPSQHRAKEPPKTKSGYRGVIFQKHCKNKPWKAYATIGKQHIALGYFPTAELAAERYNDFARKIHGPDTYLNPVQAEQDSKALLARGLELLRSARA
jgi:hypothetical protein